MYIGATEPDGRSVGIAPCHICALHIVHAGIKRVFCRKRPDVSSWKEEWEASIRLFMIAGIEFVEIAP